MRQKQFTPEYPDSLTTQITDYLTKGIVKGEIACGERLIERQLQRHFGVSRAPIRESLHILEKSGFVFKVPRKGTFVRKITRTDIEENFIVRANLESLAARLAVDHLTESDIKHMKKALTKMEKAAKRSSQQEYLKYHNDFHMAFIKLSNNNTLRAVLDDLRKLASWFRIHPTSYSIRVHHQILEHMVNRDAEKTENLVKEHILIALESFHRTYGNNCKSPTSSS